MIQSASTPFFHTPKKVKGLNVSNTLTPDVTHDGHGYGKGYTSVSLLPHQVPRRRKFVNEGLSESHLLLMTMYDSDRTWCNALDYKRQVPTRQTSEPLTLVPNFQFRKA